MTTSLILGIVTIMGLGYVIWENIKMTILVTELKNKITNGETEFQSIQQKFEAFEKGQVKTPIEISPEIKPQPMIQTRPTVGEVVLKTFHTPTETASGTIYPPAIINVPPQADPIVKVEEPKVVEQPKENITIFTLMDNLAKQIQNKDAAIDTLSKAVTGLQERIDTNATQNTAIAGFIKQSVEKQPETDKLLVRLTEQVANTEKNINAMAEEMVAADNCKRSCRCK
jgi:hypothetical protein